MASINSRIPLRQVGRQVCSLALLASFSMLLTSCGAFFVCEGKADCPVTGTTGSTSTDYAYVANSTTGSTYLNGYTLASGTLTAATDAPFSLTYIPSAMAVTPSNAYLYVTTDSAATAGYIYGYSIGTGGALSILQSGTPPTGAPLENESVTSIDISPDGKWLFALDTNGLTLEEYSIGSTGLLTFAATYGITGATNGVITPSAVKVAPTGDYVVVALGTAGAETFTFNTTTGVAIPLPPISPANAQTGIYAVAVDSNDYLYCAGTAGLQVFSTTTAGVPTFLTQYSTGNGSRSIVINSASTYVYVGDETSSTIAGFSIGTSGALTALAGSPYTAPTTVSALAHDSTNAYVIASGYSSSSGIQIFTIGTSGALTLNASAGSGTATAIPGAIAATH